MEITMHGLSGFEDKRNISFTPGQLSAFNRKSRNYMKKDVSA